MGFINGINCFLLLFGPMAIASRYSPAPGRAVFSGLLACFVAVLLRAAAPLPEVVRPWLPTELVLLALLLLVPRVRRTVLLATLSAEERRSGAAVGFAIGRFLFDSLAGVWADLGQPGFGWGGIVGCGTLTIFLVAAFAAVKLVAGARDVTDPKLLVIGMAGHVIFTAALAQYVAFGASL